MYNTMPKTISETTFGGNFAPFHFSTCQRESPLLLLLYYSLLSLQHKLYYPLWYYGPLQHYENASHLLEVSTASKTGTSLRLISGLSREEVWCFQPPKTASLLLLMNPCSSTIFPLYLCRPMLPIGFQNYCWLLCCYFRKFFESNTIVRPSYTLWQTFAKFPSTVPHTFVFQPTPLYCLHLLSASACLFHKSLNSSHNHGFLNFFFLQLLPLFNQIFLWDNLESISSLTTLENISYILSIWFWFHKNCSNTLHLSVSKPIFTSFNKKTSPLVCLLIIVLYIQRGFLDN